MSFSRRKSSRLYCPLRISTKPWKTTSKAAFGTLPRLKGALPHLAPLFASCISLGSLIYHDLHERLETDYTNEMEMNVCCGAGPPSWNLRCHTAITPRAATPENVETIVARGRGLWASIYEPHAEKLYNKLGGYHPDFIGECLPDPRPRLAFRPPRAILSLFVLDEAYLLPVRWMGRELAPYIPPLRGDPLFSRANNGPGIMRCARFPGSGCLCSPRCVCHRHRR